jgi:hypothetical protein
MFNTLPTPLNGQQLDERRRPILDGYDVYQDCLISTIDFPAAGQPVGVPLNFFSGAEAVLSDKSLTNVPQGTLPGGQMFHAQKFFCVPLIESSVAGAGVLTNVGIVDDLDRIFKTGRPQFSYTQTSINKTRGPFPLDAAGEMGGVLPDYGGNNSPAAGNNAVYQHARLPLIGGWPLDLIIYQGETFPLTITWGVQVAVSAIVKLQARHFGWRYVKAG